MCKQNGASRVDTMRPLYTRRAHTVQRISHVPLWVRSTAHMAFSGRECFCTALSTVIKHHSRELWRRTSLRTRDGRRWLYRKRHLKSGTVAVALAVALATAAAFGLDSGGRPTEKNEESSTTDETVLGETACLAFTFTPRYTHFNHQFSTITYTYTHDLQNRGNHTAATRTRSPRFTHSRTCVLS